MSRSEHISAIKEKFQSKSGIIELIQGWFLSCVLSDGIFNVILCL